MNTLTSSYFLPNRFKKIGIGLIIVHLAIILIFGLLAEFVLEGLIDPVTYWILPLLRYSVMVGLVMFISAKEKYEDEMIRHIRLKSFQYGLYMTVFVSLSLFAVSIAGNKDLRLLGVDGINAMLIYIAVIYKFNMYRLNSDEE